MRRHSGAWILLGGLLSGLAGSGCLEQRCFEDLDCPAPRVCGAEGRCAYQCSGDGECPEGFVCRAHVCQPKPVGPVTCPADMVVVADTFCADTFEASRPDATPGSPGADGSRAVSQAGVLPWMVADNATAEAACQASGKRLCSPDEWLIACQGPDGTEYAYGDGYEPTTCNGIDAFGQGRFRLAPTGAFSACTNEWGLFDINGNLWEHTAGGSDYTVRGGAFNCGDSAALHRCRYVPVSWTPSARGFRCCLTPQPPADGGGDGADGAVDPADADQDGGDGGCLPTDEDDGGAADDDGGTAEDDGGMVEDGGAPCPAGMIALPGFCMDPYEASRPDATAVSQGVDSSRAVSQPGVLPWHVSSMSLTVMGEFQAACQAAGKRLCSREEFLAACQGPEGRTYFFGDGWDRESCNSVDSFCDDHCAENAIDPCSLVENCGYQYNCFHVMPTGAFPGCTDGQGLWDVNGNVWEIVPGDPPRGYEVRGGAYNCASSSIRFVCTFNASWNALFAGFRCCADRSPS